MGTTNFGTQLHSFELGQIGRSQVFNNLNFNILPLGVFEGFDVTKNSDVEVEISRGTALIQSNNVDNVVKLYTSDAQAIAVSDSEDYVVLRHTWSNVTGENYTDMLAVSTANLLSTDVILTKLVWDGIVLDGLDITERNVSPLSIIDDKYRSFKVIANDPIDNTVKILKGGEVIVGNEIRTVSDNISIVVPDTTDGRIDYVYINESGVLALQQGVDSITPSEPDIPDVGIVIAKITRVGLYTTVDGSMITQFNPYILRYDRLINDYTEKTSIVDNDEVLIGDSADSNILKKVLHSTIKSDIQNINALTPKTSIVNADEVLINDSADSNNPKKITIETIRGFTDLTEKTTIADDDIVEINDSADIYNPKKVKHSTIKSDIQDINSLTEKTTIVNDDILLMNDSADSNNPKKVKKSTLTSGLFDFTGYTAVTPADADIVLINDASDSNNPKKVTFQNLKYDNMISAGVTGASPTNITLPTGYTYANTIIEAIQFDVSNSYGFVSLYITEIGYTASNTLSIKWTFAGGYATTTLRVFLRKEV